MNNKGFAITTILYGILILFCLLLVSLLGILSSYRKTQELLIEANHGARDIINGETHTDSSEEEPSEPDNTEYSLMVDCNGGGTINGGSGTNYEVGSYKSGVEIDLNEINEDFICFYHGVTSRGWSDKKNDTVVSYSFTMPSANVTLYPVW